MPTQTDPAAQLDRLRYLKELQDRAVAEAVDSVATFAAKCLIVAKEGTTQSGLVPFELWPEQIEALKAIETHDFLALPKGRQVGVTWLELVAMLHAGTFWGNRLFPIARQSEEYAEDAITRLLILMGYDPNSEPPNMRVLPESTMPDEWRPTIVSKTLKSLTFANGSKFKAMTATRSIARGDAAYWVLADEYAFWPWPEKQLQALEHGAHRVHVPSTGDREDDAFHKLCQAAERGEGKWRLHFIPATADPRRDPEWFRINIDESPDPDGARRELALTIEDVFRPVEGGFFKRFRRDRNVAEFDIVENWKTSKGIDFGRRHPFCVWLQVSPSGQPFVFAEYAPEEVTTPEFAQGILRTEKELLAEEGVIIVDECRGPAYCDPAGKAKNVQTSISEFKVLRDHGLRPQGQSSGVRDGCELMLNSIADPNLPLVVHPRCVKLIKALSQMPPDKNDPKVYQQKHPVFSHPLDSLRYWYVNHRSPKAADYEAPTDTGAVTAGLRGRDF